MTATAIHGLVEVGSPDAAAVVTHALGSFPSGVVALAAEVDGVKLGMVSSSLRVGDQKEPHVYHGTRFRQLLAV